MKKLIFALAAFCLFSCDKEPSYSQEINREIVGQWVTIDSYRSVAVAYEFTESFRHNRYLIIDGDTVRRAEGVKYNLMRREDPYFDLVGYIVWDKNMENDILDDAILKKYDLDRHHIIAYSYYGFFGLHFGPYEWMKSMTIHDSIPIQYDPYKVRYFITLYRYEGD